MGKKILYIRLDSSPLPEECEEFIIKDFNLGSYFCALLGKKLLEDAGLAGTMSYPGKLITDFEKVDQQAYREIIQQWEEILQSLLIAQQDENREYEINFPVSYCQWLNNREYSNYYKVNDFTLTNRRIILKAEVVYEIIYSVLLKKLTYFLQKNMECIKFIVFSIDNIDEQTYIQQLIETYNIKVVTLKQSCIFLLHDEIKTSNTSAVVRTNGMTKLIVYGERELECVYDEIDTLICGYARVRKGDKWGTINNEGVEVIPCIYNCIGSFYNETSSKELMAYAKLGDKWGYINVNNSIIIPFEYENINSFSGEYAWAKLHGKWGTIDKRNKVRIPFIYDDYGNCAYAFYDYYFIKVNSKKGIIKSDGSEYLPCIFDRIDCDSDFHIIVYKDGRQDIATFYKQNGYLRYCSVNSFCNGMAIVRYPPANGGKFGFINECGNEVVAAQYDCKPDTFTKAGFAIVCKHGKYGMINKTGKEVTPFIYDYISGIGNLHYAKKQDKYGYLNGKGEEVIPFIYDDAGYFEDGVARVKINGDIKYINDKGEIILTLPNHLPYDSVENFHDGIAVVQRNGKMGLINKQGKEILPCSYDCDAFVNRIYSRDLLIVSRGKKYGILNLEGKELIPCILDDVSPFSGEGDNFKRYGVIKRNNKYALIKISENRKEISIL